MIRWLVDHATTVFLAAGCVVLFGTAAYVGLPRESAPDITIPVVLVTTPYPGVSPEDVEGLVTIPLERELAGLKDVKVMKSTSAEGVSVVSIEFEPDVVIEDALQKVRDRINRARPGMPEDMEEPAVQEIAFSDVPILMVNLSGPVDEELLKDVGEKLQDEVARIPGVLDAKLRGGLEREVRVQIDPVRLAHYGLALHDVTGAIGDENVNIPGGEVAAGAGTILLRTPGEFTDARQVEEVAIKRVGDRPVFVRDVARVVWGFEDRQSYARLDGQPSVSLSVSKRPGANIIDVADRVKTVVAEHAKGWPAGVTYATLSDESQAIRNMVSELENNIITALILVVGVVLFGMGFRPSLFVAWSIPLSMLASFLVLQALGYTLNMIVLFSLMMALGMLVDNAIVVVENIYRHIELGKDPRQASIDGASEVALPVAASTATTVAAFVPLVFWTGIMGEFMGFLPKTLIIVLLASLFAAVVVLPALTSRVLSAKRDATGVDSDLAEPEVRGLMRGYRWVLSTSIRFRYTSAALGVATLVFTFAAYAMLNHGTEFFPDTDPERATVAVRLADGTDLETTDAVVRRIEAILADEENVDVFVAETGVSGSGSPLVAAQAASNEARVTVDFLPDANSAKEGERSRIESTLLTVERIRERAQQIPGGEITVEKMEMGPPVGAAVAVEISGDSYHAVGAFAQQLQRKLRDVPGVTDLRNDYRVGRPELRIRIDRGAAKRVGVSSGQVGNTLRTAVAGAKASALRDGEDEYDIVVEVDPAWRQDLQQVLDLRLPGREDKSPDTFPVPLSAVARAELGGGTGAIKHTDQDLVITLQGDVLDGYNENAVRAEVAALLETVERPAGIHLKLTGSNEEQEESMRFLLWAFAVGVALILLVLVAQFDSIAMPAIILASVVLSLVGVLWGLIITGTPFGVIMTGLGVISLAGVVVNNAIVLLDYVGLLRSRGVPTRDALVRAGLVRFRPVMLTAITTVLGLLPMAVGVSFDFFELKVLVGGASAQFWSPMAIAVIFGLAFATVLTLVMVPTLYSIYDDLDRLRVLAVRRVAPVVVALLAVTLSGAAQAVTLEDAFTAAEQHNLDMRMAREATIQQEAQVGLAWSTLAPTVQAQGSYTLNEYEIAFDMAEMIPPEFQDLFGGDGEPIVIQPKRFASASLTVSQPLFSATALPLLRGAWANADAARLDEEGQRQRIRAGVARAFHGLVAAREGATLADEALVTAGHELELAQRQVTAGVAPERAALQARLGVSRAEREVASARERLVQAREAFSFVTGLPSDVPLEASPLADLPPTVDDALERARAQRPDVRAAAERVDVARFQHHATWLGWAPRVDGRFTWQWSENTGFSDQKDSWMASVAGTWTLWDGGARIAQARQSASRARLAALTLERQVDTAEQEVRTLWARLERAEAALDTVRREIELAEENARLAQAAFTAGTATWLEVEQAELGVRSAELALVSERMSRDLAAVDLLVATGAF